MSYNQESNQLINGLKSNLKWKSNKYLATKTKVTQIVSILEKSLNENFDLAIASIKEMNFFVLKHLWPYCSQALLNKIFEHSPLLEAFYSSEVSKNGKPIFKFIDSEAKMKEVLSLSGEEISTLEREGLLYYLKHHDQNTTLMFFDQLITLPDLANKLMFVTKFRFGGHPGAVETFGIITNNIIARLDPEVIYPRETLTDQVNCELLQNLYKTLNITKFPELNNFSFNNLLHPNSGFKFKKLLGRTLLFSKHNSAEILAIKISKNKEDEQELLREYNMAKFLKINQAKMKLKSTLPEAITLTEIPDSILSDLLNKYTHTRENFDNLVTSQNKYKAYIYQASKEYFTYISDIEDDEKFAEAAINSMHDLMAMFANYGVIFHQLVPLFHSIKEERDSRLDGGKYQTLVSLLYNIKSPREFATVPGWDGAGTLPAFESTVKYPNLRHTGLGDNGDCFNLGEMMRVINKNLYESISYGNKDKIKNGWQNKTDFTLIANFLADYVFIIGLLVGVRNLNLKLEDNDVAWIKSAEIIVESVTQALISVINIPKNIIEQFFTNNLNVEILAKQMQFFMTKQYVSCIAEEQLFPKELFDERTEVMTIDYKLIKKHKYWIDDKGFAEYPDLGSDLGVPSSRMPITELTKLTNLLPLIFLSSRQKDINELGENNIKERYEALTEKVNGKKMEVDLDASYEISAEIILQHLTKIAETPSAVIALLSHQMPQEQLQLFLQEEIIYKALLDTFEEKMYDKVGKYEYNLSYKISEWLGKLPIQNRFEVLKEISKDSVISEGFVESLCSDNIYLLLAPEQRELFYQLPEINKVLRANPISYKTWHEILESLPQHARSKFLDYQLRNLNFNEYNGDYENRFGEVRSCFELIPSPNLFETLERIGLKKIISALQEGDKINVGAYLEHIVKLLPQEDRDNFVKTQPIKEILQVIEPHYYYQISDLLPHNITLVPKELDEESGIMGGMAA